MKNLFGDNDTFLHNLGKTLSRKEKDKEAKSIELNYVAKTEELAEIAELAIITGLMLHTFELPDTEEYDTFMDFLLFCKKISEALPHDDETEEAQITHTATEKEIEATNYMLSHAMRITARDENITNKRADKAIAIESFRRRMMQAAGK
jgi:hypothetical protein